MTRKAPKTQTSRHNSSIGIEIPKITLFIGGARSGKSVSAENYLLDNIPQSQRPLTYIATSRITDRQMQERIILHQKRRSHKDWRTLESPISLPQALEENASTPVLIDCLTLWLSNLIIEKYDTKRAVEELKKSLQSRQAPTVIITNEVGMSIVPHNPLGRQFTDQAGLLNQEVAAIAQKVVLIVAGLPLTIKNTLTFSRAYPR